MVWKLPEPPANEAERLQVLAACNIMDTGRDERFERLTRLAARFYQADVAFIGLVDSGFQWMKSVNSEDIAPFIVREDSICNMIVQSGRPLVVGDLRTDPRLQGHPVVPRLSLRFYAGVPLIMEPNLVLGSMCVMRRDPGDEQAFDLTPLIELAAIAVDEIELWKLNFELTRLSRVDALTGLANRRGFDDALDRAVRRARRTEMPLSLLLIDIDHFKTLNDRLGHPAGDDVLRRLGGLLAGAVSRPYDAVCRYGGEEFAVVLPDTDAVGARHIGELVRRLLEQAAIPHPTQARVTASIGVATFAGRDASTAALVAAADSALYEAKHGGRDRVMAWQPPDDAGRRNLRLV